MDNQPINFEEYAQTLATVMAEAVAEAERLQAEAETDRAAAHAYGDNMRDLLRSLENKARHAAEDEMPNLRNRLEQEIRATLAAKLNNAGRPDEEIAALLKATEPGARPPDNTP